MPKHSLKIDYDGILEEWLDIPEAVTAAGRECAAARFAMDVAKADMEVKEADLVKRVTANPTKYKLEKTNAKDIDAAVKMHRAFSKKQTEFFEAKRQFHIAEAKYEGFITKRKSMEAIMFFVSRDWYSSAKPKELKGTTGDFTQQMDEFQKQKFFSGLSPKKGKKK